ncbi:MAG: tRNA 4-thiouridine(8) synthase ThiI [Clostridia bacterium]|nr:tRNA 4-thiouridine(8) synthase ThiI [Clostridia bacterium]
MKQIILVKYGEIILKGLNRHTFEDLLIRNIKRSLCEIDAEIWRAQATIYVDVKNEDKIEDAIEKLKKVFGIVAIIKAYVLSKDFEEFKVQARDCLKDELECAKTFKVEAKRADKKYPLKSPEICMELGGFLYQSYPHLSVDVRNPEKLITVEVRETNIYVYSSRIKGLGGMPVGSNSKAILLLSGGIDSPVAGFMVAKRGVALEAVHFFSHPYTSQRAKDKVLELAKIVGGFTGGLKVHIVPFTDIQLEIKEKCPPEQLTLIMRRFMMAISEKIANKVGAKALVTGESIGQVASQTVEALCVTNDAVSIPVFRPVIGMDKEEIVEIARKIDTFETSVLPYEDCCTVFTPRHPLTKPKLENIKKSEKILDFDALVDAAVSGVETIEA